MPPSTDIPHPPGADQLRALRALLTLYAEWGVDCAIGSDAHGPAGLAPARSLSARSLPARSPSAASLTGASARTDRPAFDASPPDMPAPAAARAPGRDGPDRTSPGDWEDCPDLASLIARLDTLTDIPLGRTATHTLVPVHVPLAPVMIVGDVPSSDEDRAGTLFAGPSGAMLARMLGSIGLSLDAASRAPAIPWRPPGDRDATEAERAACLPALRRAIVLCAPRVVATFGAAPVRMLLGPGTQFNRVRGRWATLDLPGVTHPVRLLPMRHPTQIMTSPQARKDAWTDLLTLAEALDLPDLVHSPPHA